MKKKITFGCTTFNEEESIEDFLRSILTQSVLPDEIIIVDGGSTDKTIKKIKKIKKTTKVHIKLIIAKGANIARGRNIYTKEAKGEYLFSGDLGTRFEKDWIKKLLRGFEQGGDVVFGGYYPEKAKNIFERVVNANMKDYSKYTEEEWAKEEPSNRQAAYKISSWKKVGKFPEWMDRADDAWIYDKAKKQGLKFVPIKEAKVFWKARKNLKQYLKLAYADSFSEGVSGIIWKRKIYFFEFLFLLIFIFSVLFSFLYTPNILFLIPLILLAIFIIYMIKIFLKTKKLLVAICGGDIAILLFFAHALGAIRGFLKK